MSGKKFFTFLGIVFLIVLVIYLFTTPRGKEIPLIGVVDGNEVVVSPQITGRMIRLYVDEGDSVHQGQLIAQLDPAELQAAVASDDANIHSFEAKIAEELHTRTFTDDQTGAALSQARAMLVSTHAQLDMARATLWRDQQNTARTIGLFESGIASAQDRDTAKATLQASEANVKSLEEQVRAQEAAVGVSEANRKQIDVVSSEVVSLRAQLAQALAQKQQIETQLGYTQIYSPLDGVVSVRASKQGEVVQQGAPIVVIVDVDHLWVHAEVEESYVDSITFGQKLRVQLPSGDALEGTVFFKGVESDFATQRDVSRTKRDIKTFAIKVALPNSGHRLFTGMTATVLLPPPPSHSHWWNLGSS
ncbi:MAG: HlyD family secretion protein [Candidatus Acidiferrales bacterium]